LQRRRYEHGGFEWRELVAHVGHERIGKHGADGDEQRLFLGSDGAERGRHRPELGDDRARRGDGRHGVERRDGIDGREPEPEPERRERDGGRGLVCASDDRPGVGADDRL
jgi:hypothetical protein